MTEQLRVILPVPILSPEPLRPTTEQVAQGELLAGFRPREPEAHTLPFTEEEE